jgi:hypothetical protein
MLMLGSLSRQKQLYQEFSVIFYTRNISEFHSTMNLERFLELSTKCHAAMIRNASLVVHASRWLEPIQRSTSFLLDTHYHNAVSVSRVW